MTMSPAGAVPNVPAVAPPPSAAARSSALAWSRPVTSTALPPSTARAAMARAMPPMPMKLTLLMDGCSLSVVWDELLVLEGYGDRVASDVTEPAVDDQVCAGDEAGVRRGEEQRGGRDLFAGPQPSYGDGGGDLLREFRGDGTEERGVDRAGTDDVHPDAAILQLRSPGARE